VSVVGGHGDLVDSVEVSFRQVEASTGLQVPHAHAAVGAAREVEAVVGASCQRLDVVVALQHVPLGDAHVTGGADATTPTPGAMTALG
jgi:hypothetical protein